MADEELRISASLNDDLSDSLRRIEQRIQAVENELGDLGTSGRAAGEAVSGGADKASRSADRLGRNAKKAAREVDDLGDKSAVAGVKMTSASVGADRFGASMKRAGRRAGGVGSILQTFKWAAMSTGLFAAAGGASALGAGAAIAVGGLAPMSGAVAGLLPLLAAGKLSMLAWTLAAESMEPTLSRIKNQFTELGDVIAAGGLHSGLDYFADQLDGLAQTTGRGLAGLGAELGLAARNAGDIAKSRPFLAQVEKIFDGLRPIVRDGANALLAWAQAAINVGQAALPMAQDAADIFRQAAEWTRQWTAEQLANGKMTNWLNGAWSLFKRTIGVVVDLLIGTFNVLRIGGQYAGEMGRSIEDAAYKFRLWTESAEGQRRINQYFQDSLPTLREMGLLAGDIARGIMSMGANPNIAPLLAQIRTEFAPALGELVNKLSGQDGLGPALITAATAFVDFLTALDFSALTAFALAIASVLDSVVWLMQNVPGASWVVSGLLAAFLGFKILGPVFALIGQGAKAFSWISNAAKLTGPLSMMQKFVGGILLPTLRTLATTIGGWLMTAIRGVGIALRFAFVATPIGWVVAIIGVLVAAVMWLWDNCEWFRDAVTAAWEWIANAAVAAWDWILQAASNVIDWLVGAWDWVVAAVRSAVDFIVSIFVAIWDYGVKPVIDFVVGAFQVAWSVISFATQVAVYLIVGIITLIAVTAEAVWNLIAAGATWLWQNVIAPVVMWLWNSVILPVFTAVRDFVVGVWTAISDAAAWVWGGIVAGAQWLWGVFVAVFGVVAGWFADVVWNPIASTAQWAWQLISDAASAVWGFISGVWNAAVTFFQEKIWAPIQQTGTAIWDAIKSAATSVAEVVSGAWNGVIDVLKSAWNWIARGWNNIPSITVPDWVPLIGGQTFSMPKLPTLWHGGYAPGGTAIVGEHGPEPVVQGGRVTGMVGLNGPEVADIPRGGYVVPNLATLAGMPSLANSLPSSVAAAVSGAIPGYSAALSGGSRSGDSGLSGAIDQLTGAVNGMMPSITINGSGDAEGTRRAIEEALRQYQREQAAAGRYSYTAGRG